MAVKYFENFHEIRNAVLALAGPPCIFEFVRLGTITQQTKFEMFIQHNHPDEDFLLQ